MTDAKHIAELLDDPAAMEAHTAECAPCRAELEALARVALALPGETPSAPLRARVLDARGRFDRFASRVGELMKLPLEAARALLERIDEPAAWESGPCAGSMLVHLEPGPELAGSLCGFVKVDAGVTFPRHIHRGAEQVLVLQGALRDRDGSIVRRGDETRAPDGSEHDFVALPGPALVYLVVLEHGVDFPDLPGFVV